MSSASCDPQPDSGENQTAKYNEVNGIKVVLQNIARHYPESKTIRIAVGFIENIVENHRAGTSLDALIKICRDLKNVEVTISEEKPSVSEVRRLLPSGGHLMEVLQTRSDERAQIQVPDLRRTRRSADDLVRRMTPRSGDTTSPPQARPSTPQDEFPTFVTPERYEAEEAKESRHSPGYPAIHPIAFRSSLGNRNTQDSVASANIPRSPLSRPQTISLESSSPAPFVHPIGRSAPDRHSRKILRRMENAAQGHPQSISRGVSPYEAQSRHPSHAHGVVQSQSRAASAEPASADGRLASTAGSSGYRDWHGQYGLDPADPKYNLPDPNFFDP